MGLASIYVGAGSVVLLAGLVFAFVLGRRAWWAAIAVVVAADILTWSWISGLQTLGNLVYWGFALGIGLALLDLARTSSFARKLIAALVLVTLALAATSLWSIMRHDTLRETATLSSALAITAFGLAKLHDDPASGRKLVAALAPMAPLAVIFLFVVVIGDHAAAVAQGGGVSGFVNGANALGIILALLAPFLVAEPRVGRWLLVAALSVVSFVVTLSGSRTGLVALIVGVGAVELCRRSRLRLGLALGAVVLGAAIATVTAAPIPTLGRPLTPIQVPGVAKGAKGSAAQVSDLLGGGRAGNQSFFGALSGARDEAWSSASGLLDRRPLEGTGFGTGGEVFAYYGVRGQFKNFVGAVDPHANVHDAYLQQLLELGVPGGILFLTLPFLALVAAIVFLLRGRREAIDVALVGTALAGLTAAVFESIFAGFGAMTLLTWFAFAGLLLRLLSSDLWSAWRRRRGAAPLSA